MGRLPPIVGIPVNMMEAANDHTILKIVVTPWVKVRYFFGIGGGV